MRRAATVVGATVCLLITLFVSLQAFSQSSEQIVEQDLGRFTARVELGQFIAVRPGDSDAPTALTTAAATTGADVTTMLLESFDVRPDAVGRTASVYREARWADEPFPDRYRLITGRWPDAPGEVALTERLAELVDGTGAVPVLSGNEQVRAVATVRDRFATNARTMLAAEGTWGSFDGARLSTTFPTLAATPILLWSGGDDERVLDAVAAAVAALPESAGAPDTIHDQLTLFLRTRDTELGSTPRTWVDRIPIAYGLPSLVLPALAVITAFGLNGTRLRRNLSTLRAIGVGARDATISVATAGTGWLLLAWLAGAAAGAAAGAVARLVAQRFATRPVAPFPDLTGPIGRAGGIVALTCGVMTVLMVLRLRRTPARSPRLPGTATRSVVRRAALGVAAAVMLLIAARVDSAPRTMILVGALTATVLLAVPDLVRLGLRWMPERGPRRRLAVRQLDFDRGRAVVAVTMLAGTLGPALGMTILSDTLVTSAEAEQVSLVPRGQLSLHAVEGPAVPPPSELVADVIEAIRPADPPIRLAYLLSDEVAVRLEGNELGNLIAVDTVDEARRLANGELTEEQRAVLERGGLLVWDRPQRPTHRLVAVVWEDGRPRSVSEPLPAVTGQFEPSWQRRSAGLLLVGTADRLGLPVNRSEVVLTDMPDSAAAEARRITLAAGYDARHVDGYALPEPPALPAAYWAAVLGLGVLALVVVSTVARAQAAALRGYLAALVAIGVGPRWSRTVLAEQMLMLLALSTLLGAVIGLGPVTLAAFTVEGLTLSVPWSTLAAVLGGFVALGLLATVTSTTRLRPQERTTDGSG